MKSFSLICLLLILMSCQETKQKVTIDYKYSDVEQAIDCSPEINALLHEALLSFEDDIMQHYDQESKRTYMAYGKFLFPGLKGAAEYKRLASEHSKTILQALRSENIIINSGAKSNLNYSHPAVQCVIEGIEDNGIKNTIKALVDSNSMNPALFDTRMRNKGRALDKQRYLATYVALDAYYQYLANVEFTPASAN